jgi:hypothetical protein
MQMEEFKHSRRRATRAEAAMMLPCRVGISASAASTTMSLEAIEAPYPMLALIHVFLDDARYHHAKLVQEWLARPDCRIKLHFIPSCCPHLNPIERLLGLMLGFLRDKIPTTGLILRLGHGNFRVIDPKDFRS